MIWVTILKLEPKPVKMHTGLIFLLSLTLALLGCSQAQQVFGGNKTVRAIPLKPLKKIIASKNVSTAWQVKTGSAMGENAVHPYIGNQAVYVAGASSVSAWQKQTGKLLWKTDIGEQISAGVNGSYLNTPSIYIGTSNGNAISVNTSDGKIQWIERLTSQVLSVSPEKDGRVAFRTIDGKLHGLASDTGELIWQRSQRTPTLTLLGASVPVIVGPLVISGFDNGKIAAYQLQTGKPAWEVTLALPRGRTELERLVDVDGKIKQLGNALFAASVNGSADGIDLTKGTVVWSKKFSTSTGITGDPQGLYSTDTKGNIWKFQPQTGNPIWSIDDLLRYEPTLPALVGSSLIVLGDKKGNIHWINTQTGKFVARKKGDTAGYSVEPEVDGNAIYTIGKSGLLSKFVTRN